MYQTRSGLGSLFVALLGVVPTCVGISTSAAAQSSVQIGVAVPLSGPDAPFGKAIANGVALAVKMANDGGGLPGSLTVNVQDDQEKPEVASTVARKFCATSNMIGVVGNLASSINLSTQVVYSECGLAQISPSSSNDVLTTRGYKTFFRTEAPNAFQSAKGADFVASLPKIKNIAVIDTNDATTKAQAKLFIDEIKKKPGLAVVAHANVTENGVDFRGALTSVIAAKPDLIYVPGYFNDAALMVKQSRELGYKGTFLGIDSDVTPEFIGVAGAANAEGVYMTNLGLDPLHTAAAEKFVAAYRAAYNSDPITVASNAFDAANAIIGAWKEGGGGADRAKVVDGLHKIQVPGTSGQISFTSTGEMTNPTCSIFQVQGGKLVYLGPF